MKFIQFNIGRQPTGKEVIEALSRLQPHTKQARADGKPVKQVYIETLWAGIRQPDEHAPDVIQDCLTVLENNMRYSKVKTTARPLLYLPPRTN